MDKDTLTIRELATETGESSKALRYWESRGLLPKPGRLHPAVFCSLTSPALEYDRQNSTGEWL